MPSFSLSRNERLYVVKEVTYGTVPAIGNNDCCRFIEMALDNTVELIPRPDKTGSRSRTRGEMGRSFGRWSVRMSLAGSGVAGTLPDCDPFLEATFGKAATVVPATSVAYDLDDAIPSLSIASYRTPSTLNQRICHGAVVQEARFTFGANVAEARFSGEGQWTLGSMHFDAANTVQKGGLGAFPAEPVAPVTNGNMVIGFTGLITVDGSTIAYMKSGELIIRPANEVVKDTFNAYLPDSAEGDERQGSCTFIVDDKDETSMDNMLTKAVAKDPVTCIFQLGLNAGNIWTFTLRNVQLDHPTYTDGQRRFRANFGDNPAHATSLSSLDEFELAIT
jgi:hypothetical protein